jgi:hypothetical protein
VAPDPSNRGRDIMDTYTLMTNVNGYVPLEVAQMQDGKNVVLPTQLLGGGNHFDDEPLEARCRHSRGVSGQGPTHQAEARPRSILHDHVAQSNRT